MDLQSMYALLLFMIASHAHTPSKSYALSPGRHSSRLAAWQVLNASQNEMAPLLASVSPSRDMRLRGVEG